VLSHPLPKCTMSDLREYAIVTYFRIFLPHISRLHGPHILKKNVIVFLICLIISAQNVLPVSANISFLALFKSTIGDVFSLFLCCLWPFHHIYNFHAVGTGYILRSKVKILLRPNALLQLGYTLLMVHHRRLSSFSL